MALIDCIVVADMWNNRGCGIFFGGGMRRDSKKMLLATIGVLNPIGSCGNKSTSGADRVDGVVVATKVAS